MVNRRMRSKKNWLIHNSLRVEVVYKKSLTNWTGGRAWLNRSFVHLGVPRPPEKMIDVDISKRFYLRMLNEKEIQDRKEQLEKWNKEQKEKRIEVLKGLTKSVAKTFIHELYHCYGYTHEEMLSPRKKQWVENTYNYDWVKKYPVQMKVEKSEPERQRVDIQMKRYYKILDSIKEWQSKLKRAQNKIKSLTWKRVYYEKVLVSAGKIKKE